MSATCPHCGQPITGAPADLVAALVAVRMPRRERMVVETLLRAYPRRLSTGALSDAVYGLENDDLPWPHETLRSHVSKVRPKLRRIGWTIENRRYDGYWLARVGEAVR